MPSDRYILLIAVGPVQPFIAAARKIRDLWSGSLLLSKMSKTVARVLHDARCGLVFPAPDRLPADLAPESDFGVANKILAVTDAGTDPQALVTQVRAELDSERHALFRDVLDALPRGCVNEARFFAQRDDYQEFYAVWVPLGNDYKAARQRAEQLLSARKALRDFPAPGWEATDARGKGVRKNSLDGGRETVLADVSRTSPLVRRTHTIKLNEDLDALGLVKRCHGLRLGDARSASFDTLSDVAIAPYLLGLRHGANAKRRAKLDEAQAAIAKLGVRESERSTLLFESRLNVWLKENPDPGAETEHRAAQRALRALYDTAGEPPAYAGVLHGDGDRMGEALNQLAEPEHHRIFSSELAAFATEVRDIVERPGHGGSLIYSGGDDVLAFLPLHSALPCACEIRGRFQQAMASVADRIRASSINGLAAADAFLAARPAFSAGLAIVHHLEALTESLDTARRAEARAKHHHGRDALAIVQSIRGRHGGDLAIGGRWAPMVGAGDPADAFVPRLEKLIALHRSDAIPARLAHQLHALLKTLAPRARGPAAAQPSPLLAAEAARILARKEREGSPAALEEFAPALDSAEKIRAFADELVVAWQLARAGRIAEGLRP